MRIGHRAFLEDRARNREQVSGTARCVAAKLISRAGIGLRTAAAALAVFLTGCQGQGYLQYGVGSQLPAADIANATELQNKYFHYLCRQAGFPQDCVLPVYDQGMWTLIVRQGMNDIDRRCDAYLQWLDNKKRSKGPLLSQISDIGVATTSIMYLVDPNSAAALQIVAVAFNLISRSIVNYHSRLLEEIESSTINSVVLRARHDFRVGVEGKVFSNRPDAEYALREYLRRCLPFAIETQINDLSTLGSRGIPASDANTIFQEPILGQRLAEDVPASPREIVRPTPPPPPPPASDNTRAKGIIEERYSRKAVQEIQRKLCVRETGAFDDATRAAISIAERATNSDAPNGVIDSRTEEDILLAERDGCASLEFKFANTFEKFTFRGSANSTTKTKIAQFQTALYACVEQIEQVKSKTLVGKPAADVFASGALDENTRRAIRFVAVDLLADDKESAARSGALSENVVEAILICRFNP